MEGIKMEQEIIIIGAGSVGGHIALNPELYGIEGRIVGFLDDDDSKIGSFLFGKRVLGNIDWILDKTIYDIVIGIAFPVIKKKIIDKISLNPKIHFPSLVAKNAWISKDVIIGKGVIIYPGCSINYGSVIGDFAIMNMNCAIGHHVCIGDYTSLAPGVNFGGHTHIGSLVDIGIGVSTLQNTRIDNGATIGGQTMVISNVPEYSKAVGVPGRLV